TKVHVPCRLMNNKKTPGASKARKSATGSKPGKAPGKAPKAKSAKLPPWMPESMAAPAKPGAAKSGKPAGARPAAKPGKRKFNDDAAPQSVVRGRRKPGPPVASFDDPYASREAERYAQPIASREAILQLLDRCEGPQN